MQELDDPIPLSALQHAVYCLRQAALIHIERNGRRIASRPRDGSYTMLRMTPPIGNVATSAG
jgi:hypothetical protein